MGRPKIDPTELRRLVESGMTQADAARRFGVSEPAICQRLKKVRALGTRVVALEHAGQVVDEKLNASARLERIQQVIDGELAWAVEHARREGADRVVLQDVILKLAGEVRQQLALQLSISRALVDLRVLKEFQETVIGVIRDEDPATARRIVERLKERRALRPSAELPTLDGTGADGFVA